MGALALANTADRPEGNRGRYIPAPLVLVAVIAMALLIAPCVLTFLQARADNRARELASFWRGKIRRAVDQRQTLAAFHPLDEQNARPEGNGIVVLVVPEKPGLFVGNEVVITLHVGQGDRVLSGDVQILGTGL